MTDPLSPLFGPSGCPYPDALQAFAIGDLDDRAISQIGEHLQRCEACTDQLKGTPAADDSVVASVRRQVCDDHQPTGAGESSLNVLNRLARIPDQGAVGEADPSPSSPTRVGAYQLHHVVGSGSMGTVYKALHEYMRTVVAIKLLAPERFGDSRSIALFKREAQASGQLAGHPHIVRANDAGEANGHHFIAMDYVNGVNLSQVLNVLGPLEVADACEVIRQAALGLEYAHENDLIHRDVKPSNLLLGRDGLVRLSDLGLVVSRATLGQESGFIVGTAEYMAPEQWDQADRVTRQADLYSLGCTLFRLLTGRPPYEVSPRTNRALRDAHCNAPVPAVTDTLSHVPSELDALVRRLMAKESTDRCESAAQVAEQLEPFSANHDLTALVERALPLVARAGHSTPTEALPAGTTYEGPAARERRRNKFVRGSIALVFAAMVMVWIGTLVGRFDDSNENWEPEALSVNPGGNVLSEYYPDVQRLTVSSRQQAMYRFGTSDDSDYRVSTNISLSSTGAWPGGAGIFIEHRAIQKEDGPTVHDFQPIYLRPVQGLEPYTHELVWHDTRVTVWPEKPDETKQGPPRKRVATDWRAYETTKTPVTLDAGDAHCRLEVHVVDREVARVFVNGEGFDFSSREDSERTAAVAASDEGGAFGVYCKKGSVDFTRTRSDSLAGP